MAPRRSNLCIKSSIQRRRVNCAEVERVMRELETAIQSGATTRDPIVEQLKQCPEAFKVGEILGKAFDSLKYAQDGGELGDRYLPPAGVIIPPLV
ncbi:MAG: hypothetical protein WB762_23750 [Candidatus Sulfotelmatobacter sp.]